MQLTPEEEKIAERAKKWVRKHKNDLIEQYASLEKSPTRKKPLVVFMAGSPGAGKTEFSTALEEALCDGEPLIARIDPDEIRMNLPGYEGGKAYVLHSAVTRAVHEIVNSLLNNKQSFILDGTFSNYDNATQNIERALKRGYHADIFYIYQEPESAWEFTQAREKSEGRRIELETFVYQYFAAKDVVNKIKQQYDKKIRVMLVVKDIKQNIKNYEIDIDRIDDYLKQKYNERTLLETLTQ